MKIKVMIAMHKPYVVPGDDLYYPLQVGAKGKEPFAPGDDTGEHISEKNPFYCELTALYWGWKNLKADALGLVHYRRHFTMKGFLYRRLNPKIDCVLTGTEAEALLQEHDAIVPKKRRYYIETLYSHYAHTLDAAHLDAAQEIIAERCPEYLGDCRQVYGRTWGYMFNMCIMKREALDAYCSWLFPILKQLEERLMQEKTERTAFEARLYGRVSEILFNVWLAHHTALSLAEVPTMYMEPVHWGKKGAAFLMAKFFGKKYKESF